MEENDLMKDLKDLPRNSVVRKINELVKRVRLAKVHAYVISYLKEQMPMLMGHAKKQAQVCLFEFFICFIILIKILFSSSFSFLKLYQQYFVQ